MMIFTDTAFWFAIRADLIATAVVSGVVGGIAFWIGHDGPKSIWKWFIGEPWYTNDSPASKLFGRKKEK